MLSIDGVKDSEYKKDGQTFFGVKFSGHYVSASTPPFKLHDFGYRGVSSEETAFLANAVAGSRVSPPLTESMLIIGKEEVISAMDGHAMAEARLIGPDGTLYAHATTTCLVFEMK